MKEITIEEIIHLAEQFHSNKKSWHFHMLTPDCIFNEDSTRYAFVLENRSDHKTYITYSETPHVNQGKHLVQLLHGNTIISKVHESTEAPSQCISEICCRAEKLNSQSLQWHHHMLFPDCVFNEHSGQWNIIFEDKSSGEILEATYETEPTSDLRAIEVLYYAQKSH